MSNVFPYILIALASILLIFLGLAIPTFSTLWASPWALIQKRFATQSLSPSKDAKITTVTLYKGSLINKDGQFFVSVVLDDTGLWLQPVFPFVNTPVASPVNIPWNLIQCVTSHRFLGLSFTSVEITGINKKLAFNGHVGRSICEFWQRLTQN